MKRCNKCGVLKPFADFYRMAGMRDGYRNDCKACNLAAQARRYRANPEANRARVREWQRTHPERVAEKAAAYRASGAKSLASRKSHLKRQFGLTLEAYDAMLREQGGVCRICGRTPKQGRVLHVDHDHVTGRLRALLCFTCNNALGDFADDPDWLRAAARYVEVAQPRDEVIKRRLADLRALRLARDGA